MCRDLVTIFVADVAHHILVLLLHFCPLFRWRLGVFLVGSDSTESAHNAGDLGSIFGSGRSPGEGNGNPLQYACLRNRIVRGAWWATVHGITKSDYHFHSSSECFWWIGCVPRGIGLSAGWSAVVSYIILGLDLKNLLPLRGQRR